MLAIRLDKEIERDLDLLARRRGSNRSAVVREAILQYLEDNEDLDLAKQAQSQTAWPQAAETIERRTWLGQLKSATSPNGNCENWIGRFKSVFSTGSTTG